jgi:hypothetical protein
MNAPAAPSLEPRRAPAARGWAWIVEGFALFRAAPMQWGALTVLLFAALKLLSIIPLVGLVAVIAAPNFLAGLSHGAQALERGKPLRAGYLLSGFLKSGAPLALIGALSLAGYLGVAMVTAALGGEALRALAELGPAGIADPANAGQVQALAPALTEAMIAGIALSVPIVLATWFAPLIVFFDDTGPLAALWLSLKACLRNVGAFVVYGAAVMAGLVLLLPFSLATRQLDLGWWMLAPVLVPSVYASYKDLFPGSRVTRA